MCIAILNTKGATLKKGVLKNCWDNNGDGAGLLYINDDKQMMTFKEMKSFDAFYEEYGRVKKLYGSRNIVLHFRISTHGKVDETNCHPFLVSEKLGFVHNGMIYSVPESKDYSDTYMFNETVLKYLNDGFEYNEVILDMMEGFINSSKLIFLNNEDHYAIVNEKAGHWSNQCWFSNSSYKQVNNYVDYGGIKKYKNDWGYGASYGAGNIYGQSWGNSYEPYVYTREPKQVERDEEELLCYECGMHLYDKDEINFGTCTYCQMEQHEHLNDECEGCLGTGGKYNEDWFDFYIDEKHTIWYRNKFEIQAKTLEEAKAKVITICNKDPHELPSDDRDLLHETVTYLNPEDNDGEATQELYEQQSGNIIWTNK